MSVGVLAYLGVGVESSVAAAAGNTNSAEIVDYIPFVSETLEATREDLDSQELRQSWDQAKVYGGIQRVGGQINVEVHPISFGWLCRMAFDATTAMNGYFGNAYGVTGQSSHATIRTHRFTTGQTQFQAGSGSDLPCMTFEIFRGPAFGAGSSFYYYMCTGNNLEVTIEQGQICRGAVDVMGRDYDVHSKTSPSLPGADAFLWHQASVTFDGAAKATYESLTFRVNNNMETINRIGSGLRADQIKRNNFRQIEANGNLTFDNLVDYDAFRLGSEGQLLLHFDGSVIDPSVGSNLVNVLRIDIPKFRYSTYPIGVAGPGRFSIGWTGRGVLDTTSNYSMEIMLTNTRTNDYSVNSNA
jgi:hypothetical protein